MSKDIPYTELPPRVRDIILAEITISDFGRSMYLQKPKPALEWANWIKKQDRYKHIADELISDPLFIALLLSGEVE